jgi:uncharacterized protein GlcG (DUF336 family)
MYKKDVMSYEEARAMGDAVLAESKKISPELPIAIAIVDTEGQLIFFAREDGAYPWYCDMAIHKAYTASRVNTDTGSWAEFQKTKNREMASWLTCNPKMVGIEGGVVIKRKGGTDGSPKNTLSQDKLGGIGVSGKWSNDDDALARLGLKVFHDMQK